MIRLYLWLSWLCSFADVSNTILNLTTFNTYQIVTAPHREESREAQFKIIREQYAHKTDVFCLQELFYPEDIQTYREELAELYPYSYSELNEWDEDQLTLPQVSCDVAMVDRLLAFRTLYPETATCFHQCESDFLHQPFGTLQSVNCIIEACLVPKTDLDELEIMEFLREFQRSSCLHCLGAAFLSEEEDADLSMKEMLSYCATEIDYNYRPTSGLLLLSKYPLSNTQMIRLPSSFDFQRAMIMADIDREIDGADNAPLTIGCMHPQAPYANSTDALFPIIGVDQVTIDMLVTTSPELAALQLTLIAHHLWRNHLYSDFILMGDFNVGPKYQLAMYEEFLGDFMMDIPHLYKNDVPGEWICTFCSDNPLNEERKQADQFVDHIVYHWGKNVGWVREKYRCFDERVEYEVNGVVQEWPLSDHYGICSCIDFAVPDLIPLP